MSNAITVGDVTVTTTSIYSYHGFNAYINSVELNVSATIRVSIAYLVNGKLDTSQVSKNDGTYSYINKYVLIDGQDYTNWGNDDSYIVNYVRNNFETILNSTYLPESRLHSHLLIF